MVEGKKLFNWVLPHPIIVASGPFGAGLNIMKTMLEYGAAAVVTKSISEDSNQKTGIIHINDNLFNCEGFSKKPMETWKNIFSQYHDLPIIANVSSKVPSEIPKIAKEVADWGAQVIEVGVSCPNFSEDPFCFDIDLLHKICCEVRKVVEVPIVVKIMISTSSDLNRNIAQAIHQAGIDGITLSDSLPGIITDKFGNFQRGGITGAFLKSMVLKAFDDIANIDIVKIGSGGIFNGFDVCDYINAGASAVQVCTALIKNGPSHLKNIIDQYYEVCE
mgnify:FL=1